VVLQHPSHLSDFTRILEATTLIERRTIIQAFFMWVRIDQKRVKAIQPTNACMALWAG